MPSYTVDPFILLSELGSSAAELNDSFLPGLSVQFSRPVEFEDYALLGFEYSFSMLAQANKSWSEIDEDGNPSLVFTGDVSTYVVGTVIEFFENELGLFVRFEEWFKTPQGEVVSNCWKLPSETKFYLSEEE